MWRLINIFVEMTWIVDWLREWMMWIACMLIYKNHKCILVGLSLIRDIDIPRFYKCTCNKFCTILIEETYSFAAHTFLSRMASLIFLIETG